MNKNSFKTVVLEYGFVNNIKELEKFIKNNGINLVAKLIAYHGAGGSLYGSVGGGAALINKFIGAFKEAFDPTVDNKVFKIEDGINYIAGLKVIIESNIEAYDIKIPELNCVYTHMLGHDCHSIVVGV